MKLIEILYKLVKNPKSSDNYKLLKGYFDETNQPEFADAVTYLLEKRYVNNDNNTQQE